MGRMKNWLEIYLQWKAANPTAKDETRKRVVRSCVGKLAHPDYLSAYIHAMRLQKDKGAKKLVIYECPLCHKAHVGNWKGAYAHSGQQPWERDRRNWRHYLEKNSGGIGLNPEQIANSLPR